MAPFAAVMGLINLNYILYKVTAYKINCLVIKMKQVIIHVIKLNLKVKTKFSQPVYKETVYETVWRIQ